MSYVSTPDPEGWESMRQMAKSAAKHPSKVNAATVRSLLSYLSGPQAGTLAVGRVTGGVFTSDLGALAERIGRAGRPATAYVLDDERAWGGEVVVDLEHDTYGTVSLVFQRANQGVGAKFYGPVVVDLVAMLVVATRGEAYAYANIGAAIVDLTNGTLGKGGPRLAY